MEKRERKVLEEGGARVYMLGVLQSPCSSLCGKQAAHTLVVQNSGVRLIITALPSSSSALLASAGLWGALAKAVAGGLACCGSGVGVCRTIQLASHKPATATCQLQTLISALLAAVTPTGGTLPLCALVVSTEKHQYMHSTRGGTDDGRFEEEACYCGAVGRGLDIGRE